MNSANKARDIYRKLWQAAPIRVCTRPCFALRGNMHIFPDITMEEQREKLHAAAGQLLIFDHDDPNPMSPYASSHRALGLKADIHGLSRRIS